MKATAALMLMLMLMKAMAAQRANYLSNKVVIFVAKCLTELLPHGCTLLQLSNHHRRFLQLLLAAAELFN